MNPATTLIIGRIVASCIFAIGAIILMYFERDYWWCAIIASVLLGSVTWSQTTEDDK